MRDARGTRVSLRKRASFRVLTPTSGPIECPHVDSYLPILVLAVLAAALPLGTIIVARVIQSRRPNPAKEEPYESGIAPSTNAFDTRFSVRYFLIAVLFVVFDVETIFLFPWAVYFHRLGVFGLVEMLIFLAILIVGYFYVWKRQALDWA
jgi:NADH-quinone oxidoreductase subunit A